MADEASDLNQYVSYLCLVYHEARNVRHLVKAGHVDSEPYRQLWETLPTNRYKAWAALQPLCRDAIQRLGLSAHLLFELRFRLSLGQLVELFDNPGWKHSPLGGNQWRDTTRAVAELRDALGHAAIGFDDPEHAARLLRDLPEMRHNTGSVRDKLRDLDAGLEA